MSEHTAANVVNELMDDELLHRLSFANFASKLRKYCADNGRAELVLTFQAAPGAPAESIDVDELASPRTGIYRCRLKFAPQKFLEAQYTSQSDQMPRDGKQSLELGWQSLNDYQMVRIAQLEKSVNTVEERWRVEHQMRIESEERVLQKERRIVELEAMLADEQPIFDDSIITLFKDLFTQHFGIDGLRDEAAHIIDQCSEFVNGEEVETEMGKLLLNKAPHVIHFLARLAGQDGEQENS